MTAAGASRRKVAPLDWLERLPSAWAVGRLKHLAAESKTKCGLVNEAPPMLSVSGYFGVIPKEYEDANQMRSAEDVATYLVVRPRQLVANTMWLNFRGLGVSDHEGIVSPAYRAYDLGPDLLPRFVHHLLRSDPYVGEYTRLAYGIRPNSLQVSRDDFAALRLAVPPLSVQKAIAELLDRKTAAIDALIEKKQKLLELLAEKRAALINQAVTKGLDPNVPMKDSGIPWIGQIPAHWEMKRLKHLSPNVSVGIVITPAKYYSDEGTVPALRSLNVRERRIQAEGLVYISQESNRLLAKSIVRAGDLLSVRTGQPGKTAVVPKELDGANCVDVIIVRRGARYCSDYVCEFMNSLTAKVQYTEGAEGAIQQHFNVETASSLIVPTPPLAEQGQIVSHLDNVHRREDRLAAYNRAQIERLVEFRQALITAAVTGQLDVTEAT